MSAFGMCVILTDKYLIICPNGVGFVESIVSKLYPDYLQGTNVTQTLTDAIRSYIICS